MIQVNKTALLCLRWTVGVVLLLLDALINRREKSY